MEYDYFIEPPFFGTGEVLKWNAAALLENLNRERLFKAWWGGGNLNETAYASAQKEEFTPAYERLAACIVKDELVDARGFYGFFPVISEKETVSILDPSDYHTELAAFTFPRMEKSGLSLADYIRPEGDVLSVQAVSIGALLSERSRDFLQNQGRYSDGFYLNGIANFLVETIADKVSAEIRRALGLSRDAGRRYSFGYSGLPGLEEQKRLLELMGVEERLGITLTEGFQMEPEHSTVAVFVHHPRAEYLS
ncbi:MAG: hypothetical protein LBI42_11830 [Chitinispirillales bacterium]|jgi:5-methyltetrahydrofolate--homocysteine methyltransferase|nr:hypothetical protein [Chitinispirillales bacterium]